MLRLISSLTISILFAFSTPALAQREDGSGYGSINGDSTGESDNETNGNANGESGCATASRFCLGAALVFGGITILGSTALIAAIIYNYGDSILAVGEFVSENGGSIASAVEVISKYIHQNGGSILDALVSLADSGRTIAETSANATEFFYTDGASMLSYMGEIVTDLNKIF